MAGARDTSRVDNNGGIKPECTKVTSEHPGRQSANNGQTCHLSERSPFPRSQCVLHPDVPSQANTGNPCSVGAAAGAKPYGFNAVRNRVLYRMYIHNFGHRHRNTEPPSMNRIYLAAIVPVRPTTTSPQLYIFPENA